MRLDFIVPICADCSDNADGVYSARPFKAGHSTHSLNDVGFPVRIAHSGRRGFHLISFCSFLALARQLIPALPAKSRESPGAGGVRAAAVASAASGASRSSQEPSKWLSPRILTLQKSISTPSILAVKDGSTLAALSAAASKGGSSSAVASGNESAALAIQAAHSATVSAKDANSIPVPSS